MEGRTGCTSRRLTINLARPGDLHGTRLAWKRPRRSCEADRRAHPLRRIDAHRSGGRAKPPVALDVERRAVPVRHEEAGGVARCGLAPAHQLANAEPRMWVHRVQDVDVT